MPLPDTSSHDDGVFPDAFLNAFKPESGTEKPASWQRDERSGMVAFVLWNLGLCGLF